MRSNTKALLAQFETSELFRNCGKANISDVIVLSNWNDAISNCQSLQWENTGLDAAAILTQSLHKFARDRYQEWNSIVDQVKRCITPMLVSKLNAVQFANNLPNCFYNSVQWDIVNACMEAEYSDIVRLGPIPLPNHSVFRA